MLSVLVQVMAGRELVQDPATLPQAAALLGVSAAGLADALSTPSCPALLASFLTTRTLQAVARKASRSLARLQAPGPPSHTPCHTPGLTLSCCPAANCCDWPELAHQPLPRLPPALPRLFSAASCGFGLACHLFQGEDSLAEGVDEVLSLPPSLLQPALILFILPAASLPHLPGPLREVGWSLVLFCYS